MKNFWKNYQIYQKSQIWSKIMMANKNTTFLFRFLQFSRFVISCSTFQQKTNSCNFFHNGCLINWSQKKWESLVFPPSGSSYQVMQGGFLFSNERGWVGGGTASWKLEQERVVTFLSSELFWASSIYELRASMSFKLLRAFATELKASPVFQIFILSFPVLYFNFPHAMKIHLFKYLDLA